MLPRSKILDSPHGDLLLRIIEQQSILVMNKLSAKSAKLILSDGYDYTLQLVQTTIRSLLTPIFFLTDWVEKTDDTRHSISIDYLVNQICIKVLDGTLIPDLKKLSQNFLLKREIHPIREFYCGSLLKVIKHKLIGSNSKVLSRRRSSEHFLYSMVNLKAGLSRLPNDYVFKNVQNTVKELSVEPPPLPPVCVQYLKFAVYLLFNGKKDNVLEKRRLLAEGATYTNRHSELKKVFLSSLVNLQDHEREEAYDKQFGSHILRNKPSLQRARVAILDEPLKNRFLTINSDDFQAGTRDLQQDLISRWKSLSCSTMDDSVLNVESLNHNSKLVPKNEGQKLFYSVDYSAATDKLNANVTKVLIKEILDYYNITDQEREFYINALAPKSIGFRDALIVSNFPSKSLNRKIKRLGKFLQINGQMMGNTLSFPLLCLANLASFIYAQYSSYGAFRKAIYNQNYDFLNRIYQPLREVGVSDKYINGDDAVAALFPHEIELHYKICDMMGFDINANKTIISPDRFNINSRMYIVSNNIIHEVGYLNQRVLYNWNVKKTLKGHDEGSKEIDSEDYIGLYNKLYDLNGFLNLRYSLEIQSFFRKLHHKFLPKGFKVFLSPNVGGDGMYDLFQESSPHLTRQQCLVIENNMRRQLHPTDDFQFYSYGYDPAQFESPIHYISSWKEDVKGYPYHDLQHYKEHSELLSHSYKVLLNHLISAGVIRPIMLPSGSSFSLLEVKTVLMSLLSERFKLYDLQVEPTVLFQLLVEMDTYDISKLYRGLLYKNIRILNRDVHFFETQQSGWHFEIPYFEDNPFSLILINGLIKNLLIGDSPRKYIYRGPDFNVFN